MTVSARVLALVVAAGDACVALSTKFVTYLAVKLALLSPPAGMAETVLTLWVCASLLVVAPLSYHRYLADRSPLPVTRGAVARVRRTVA